MKSLLVLGVFVLGSWASAEEMGPSKASLVDMEAQFLEMLMGPDDFDFLGHELNYSPLVSTNHRFRIGERAFNIQRKYARVEVIAREADGDYVLEFLNGELKGKIGGNWSARDLAKMHGCRQGFCVGDRAINTKRKYARVRIKGIQANGSLVVKFKTGELSGRIGGNWDRQELAKIEGCGGRFCVGDRARNAKRKYARVRVIGIEHDRDYVLKFLTGDLTGRVGGNWDDQDLVRTRRD